jgi:cytochrome bd-type quinol oxidase subunit 2
MVISTIAAFPLYDKPSGSWIAWPAILVLALLFMAGLVVLFRPDHKHRTR